MGFARVSLLALSILLVGCRSYVGTDYMNKEADFAAISRVAVLPFENQSKTARAGERIMHVFTVELLSSMLWEVVDSAQVQDALRKAAVSDAERMSAETIARLGQSLKTQALVFGSVEEYAMEQGPDGAFPVVSVSVRLVDVGTARILWAGHLSANGRPVTPIISVGAVETLSELSRLVCARLVRTMVR